MKARAAVDPEFAAKLKKKKELDSIGKMKGTSIQSTEIGGGTKAGKEFTKSSKFFANLQEQVDQEKLGLKPKKKREKTDQSGASFKL